MNFHDENIHLSGLEKLKRFEQCSCYHGHGMEGNVDMQVVEIELGRVVYRYEPKERHVNLFSSIHGGLLSTLLDSTIGAAIITTLGPGERDTITELHIRFMKPVFLDGGPLTVEGVVESSGKRLLFGEGWVRNADGRLMARGSATAIRL